VVIRSYGAASTRIRSQLGWIEKADGKRDAPVVAILEGEESGFVRVRKRTWARLIRKVWLDDPEICKRCGERMKILSAFSSPAQDQAIEKILRARGEWDPPWLREREARGPPAVVPDPGPAVQPWGETRIEYDDGHLHARDEDEIGGDPDLASEEEGLGEA